MKYTNYTSFEKHIAEAGTQHLAAVYFLSCAHEADRLVMLEKMASSQEAEVIRFSAASFSKEILPLVRELSLFSPLRFFVIEDFSVEQDEEALLRFLQNAPPKTHLFCGIGKEPKSLGDLVKKGAVWLDLGKEKPWEREKRLLLTLRETVLKAGKMIAPELLEQMIHFVGADWQKLESELQKIVAFLGNRRDITFTDIEKVAFQQNTISSWQIAEEIVWGKTMPYFSSLESHELISLLGAIRYQIQMGWQLAHQMTAQFKPYQVQKYSTLASGKPPAFFEKALLKLGELELLAKSGSIDPRLLITCFAAQVRGQ